MDSFMNHATLYKFTKVEESALAIKYSFIQTFVHIMLLLICIIILTAYYSQVEETQRETIQVERTEFRWIPYSQYSEAYEKHRFGSIFQCQCSLTQIGWSTFSTEKIDVNTDGLCNGVLFAYNACYQDPFCRDGDVGNIIYYNFQDVCSQAKALYPITTSSIDQDLLSATVLTLDELDEVAVTQTSRWKNDISRSLWTSYNMMYPRLSIESGRFYDWAVSTSYEDLINESYWRDVWNLNYNTSYYMTDAWIAAGALTDSYASIEDAIRNAFIDNIIIDYRYSNNDTEGVVDGIDFSGISLDEPGYYQVCAPYECTWLTATKKGPIELVAAVFGLLGGIHAALFVIVNIICGGYRKCKGIEISDDENQQEKERLQTEMALRDQQAIMKDGGDTNE